MEPDGVVLRRAERVLTVPLQNSMRSGGVGRPGARLFNTNPPHADPPRTTGPEVVPHGARSARLDRLGCGARGLEGSRHTHSTAACAPYLSRGTAPPRSRHRSSDHRGARGLDGDPARAGLQGEARRYPAQVPTPLKHRPARIPEALHTHPHPQTAALLTPRVVAAATRRRRARLQPGRAVAGHRGMGHRGMGHRRRGPSGVRRRVGRATSGVGCRASDVGRRTSDVGRRASGASDVGRRARGVGRRASGVGRRASGVGRVARGTGG